MSHVGKLISMKKNVVIKNKFDMIFFRNCILIIKELKATENKSKKIVFIPVQNIAASKLITLLQTTWSQFSHIPQYFSEIFFIIYLWRTTYKPTILKNICLYASDHSYYYYEWLSKNYFQFPERNDRISRVDKPRD